MKIKKNVSLLVVLIMAFSACKKSDNAATQETPKAKLKYLTRTVVVETAPASSGGGTTSFNIDYSYDDKKRLISVKRSNSVKTFTYNDNGTLFTMTSSNGPNTDTYVTEFSYTGTRVKSYNVKLYRNGSLLDDVNYEYVYDGDKATELHWAVYYALFTYDSKGNLTKVFNHGPTDYTQLYTYDDKKSMYINSAFKFPVISELGSMDRLSPNNRLTGTTEGLSLNLLNTNTYVYDDEGYPIAGTLSTDYKASSTYKYSYQYSTLD